MLMKNLLFITSVLLLSFFSFCSADQNVIKLKTPPPLPPIFQVDYKNPNLDREAREHKKRYKGKIIDTHVHLYPPKKGVDFKHEINKYKLQEIIDVIENSGVETVIIMPTPNDGIRRNQEMGVTRRIVAKELAPEMFEIFYGSNYITNWLDNAYRNGYKQQELNSILKRLEKEGSYYFGVGEIGCYHFDKGYGSRAQHRIEFPLNFEPFLKVIDVIAKKGLWLDLHIEPKTKTGVSYEDATFGGLEEVYQRAPNLKLIYSHTAMTNVKNVKEILKRYPNIIMNIKIEPRHSRWGHLGAVVNDNGEIYEDWAELFEAMPERFMVGSDFHFGRKGVSYRKYKKKMKMFRKALGSLDPKAVKMIAYDNAKKLIEDGRKTVKLKF